MKLLVLLTLVATFHASAGVIGQNIRLSKKDASLKSIFKEIKKQSGIDFIYNSDLLNKAHPVTLDVKDMPLETVLEICFKDQPLSYELLDKTITVGLKEVAAAGWVGVGPGPVKEITGRVTNTYGESLANANIVVKRTNKGTITNAAGEFSLNGLRSEDIIQVSYIGYKSQTIYINNQSKLVIVLEAVTNNLDKVVVQAYGLTTQRVATGDIGSVRAEDIEKQPIMNPLEALQGQLAGVVITNTSGYASGSIKVEIRGRNSINPNFTSDPLYIIDGVPLSIENISGEDSYTNGSQGMIQTGLVNSPANGQSPIFSINPSDIESIEVLKDADATAIYGSRGANGVILITTKKGRPGKTHFDFNIYQGISKVDRQYKFLNTQQYVQMREEALRNDGLPLDINNAPDLVIGDTTRFVNWQKILFGGQGKETDAEASLSGGDTRTTFRIGAGYHYQTEILTSSGGNKRGSLSFNLAHNSRDQRLNIILSGSYSATSINTLYLPGSINLAPNGPAIYDSMGKPNFVAWDAFTNSIGNYPFSSLLQNYTSSTSFLNGNLVLNYQLVKNLKLRTSLGYNSSITNQTYLTPIASQDPAQNPTGQSAIGNTQFHNVIVEPQLEYNNFIGKGKLNFLLGGSIQSNVTSAVTLVGYNYTTDAYLTEISAAPDQSGANNTGEFKYEAVFSRINYNWSDKYILNLNARRDGDTRFAPGRQFGNFGSVGAAWIFTEENWVKKNITFLSFGKLRGSYGTTGSDQISDYQYLSRWQFGSYQYNGNVPLYPLGHTDSLIHWQINKKLEFALDLGLLSDNITLEAAWFRNRCDDQLVNFPTPELSGFTSVVTNSPANVQNSGWEFTANSKIVNTDNFKFSIKFNIGLLRNKLLAYPNLSQSPYAGSLRIGQSINLIRKLHFTGVDPQTGQYTFEDKNHDGSITYDQTGKSPDDSYTIDITPKYDGGLTMNFDYKKWNLTMFFYFKKQLGINALSVLDAAGDMTNQPVEILNRWQKPGDKATYAAFTTQPGTAFSNFQQFSDATITNASFIRLRNLSLSYTLDAGMLKKAGISRIQVFIRGQNLFLITRYKDSDPEIQKFGGLPVVRFLTAGISCNL